MDAGYKVTTVSRSLAKWYHKSVDLTDKEASANLAKQLCKVDTIIHCAAIAMDKSLLATSQYQTVIR